jgi:hypothetical protein
VKLFSNGIKSDNPKVYFIPKSDGLGIIGLSEIVTSLQLTDEFFDENQMKTLQPHKSIGLFKESYH